MGDQSLSENIFDNSSKAVTTSTFYDSFWNDWPVTPVKSERARGIFASKAISSFVKHKNLEILDLGCGRGWMSMFLHEWGHVTGVDFSPQGIEFAQKHYPQYADFRVADPEDMYLGVGAEKKFDVIVCSEVIEHVENQPALMHQISRFLKVGGLCILTTPNANVWDDYWDEDRKKNWSQPIENWLTPSQLKQVVTEAGFRVRRHHGFTSNGLRFGSAPVRFILNERIRGLSEQIGIGNFYQTTVLPFTLYQMIAAVKVS
jgi:SAM-dependent methyltransferase